MTTNATTAEKIQTSCAIVGGVHSVAGTSEHLRVQPADGDVVINQQNVRG